MKQSVVGKSANHAISSAEEIALFRQRVSLCDRASSLNFLCLRFASRIGVISLAYHHLPAIGSAEPIGLNAICVGFPSDLVSHFEDNRIIQVDPTIHAILSGGTAKWWGELDETSKLSKKERAYLEFAASKVGVGLHLPTYGPNGRQGYVSMGFGAHMPDFGGAELASLQLCCQIAHQHYCQLLHKPLPRNVRLSPREREILSWVAEGKSNGVIAEILQITESSVITYLERAFRKLEVDNRVTASLRASTLGQLRHL